LPETDQPTLRREIGRWDLAGLMINATIGAGILGLPGQVYALVGSWGVLMCLAGGVLMALIATCLAEVGSRFARTGGVYVYVAEAFGAQAGLIVGVLTIVSRLLSFAGIANLAVIYSAPLLPFVAAPLGRYAFIVALTLALSLPIWFGVRLSALTHNAFSLIKMALLLGFCACAVPAFLAHGIPHSPLPSLTKCGPALVLLLFGLGGLEAAVVSNGEMRDPGRDLPFALLAGMAVVVALYSVVLLSAMALVPDLAHASRPVFEGYVRVLGPAAGVVVVVASVVSMTGVMFATLFGGPRLMFAMAEEGRLPAAFARVHPRWRTPHRAILVHSLAALALALSFGFIGAITASTFTRLITYAIIAIASITLRRRGFSETSKALVLPGSRLRVTIVLILFVAILGQITRSEMISFAIVVALSLALAALPTQKRKV
jgi:amino acid transporter